MSVEKLSISFESDLVGEVRAAAAEAGLSVSTWLADAATAKTRQNRLRQALDEYADEFGALDDAEVEALVAEARSRSIVSRPRPT